MKSRHRWANSALIHSMGRYILGAVLLIPAVSSQAATLAIGDVLSFTSAAGSGASGTYITSGNPADPAVGFNSASLDSLTGIVIGTAQPSVPDIDQTWLDAAFNAPGNHYTTSPVNVLNSTTLDLSGWVMYWSATPFNFGATQGIATYSFDGTNYTLDYSWDADTDNGGALLGGVQTYNLHLSGTVTSLPIPAAMWLFGSGLLGLIGMARRKK